MRLYILFGAKYGKWSPRSVHYGNPTKKIVKVFANHLSQAFSLAYNNIWRDSVDDSGIVETLEPNGQWKTVDGIQWGQKY